MAHPSSVFKKEKVLLLNWGIAWGLLFSAIGFKVYLNYHQERRDVKVYKTQYNASLREIDSLRVVKSQLERELHQIKSNQGNRDENILIHNLE